MLDCGSTHSEHHELEQGWHGVGWPGQYVVELLTLLSKVSADLLFFLLCLRIKTRDGRALQRVESKALAKEIEIIDNFVPTTEPLRNDAGEGFPIVARPVKGKTESIEKHFHDPRQLEAVVRGCKDYAIRCHDLLKQHVTIIFQRAKLLALIEADPAAPANPELVVAQGDDFVLHITKSL